jgi:hypothetical protein
MVVLERVMTLHRNRMTDLSAFCSLSSIMYDRGAKIAARDSTHKIYMVAPQFRKLIEESIIGGM